MANAIICTLTPASPSNVIRVIGKLEDTGAYEFKKGYEIYSSATWSVAENHAWMQAGIEVGAPFKLVSLTTPANMINSAGAANIGPTAFGREVWQLMGSGYKSVGKGSSIWLPVKK
jgi:hypothetical protein